ncbi:hypothetical protein COOONC_15310 [Cooperia oncophora]
MSTEALVCPEASSNCSLITTQSLKINPLTREAELTEANAYPGITNRTESCGFWGCDCGFPSSGCLFYRVYKKPVSSEIYEIFQCPTCYETVSVILEISRSSGKTREYFRNLQPNVQKAIFDDVISITNLAVPPIPLSNSQFIRKNQTIAMIPSNSQSTYACANRNSTHLEECIVKDSCTCTPAQNEVNCYCTDDRIDEMFTLQSILPHTYPNFALSSNPHSQSNPTIRTQSASLEMSLTLNISKSRIRNIVSHFSCSISVPPLQGCYGCLKGALATFTCRSSINNVLAQVECSTQAFAIPCSRTRKETPIRLFYPTARVNDSCTVLCGRN